MNAFTNPGMMEAAQEAGASGADLRYMPGKRVFANSAGMLLSNGWSVWPQERDGKRMPSRVKDRVLSWSPYQKRHATLEELALWCKEAGIANVACALGSASGHTFAVDIDCLDEVVSRWSKKLAPEHLGHTPLLRIGRAPKGRPVLPIR